MLFIMLKLMVINKDGVIKNYVYFYKMLIFYSFMTTYIQEKYRKRTPKDSRKQQNCKCCRLGLMEPVHGR